MANTLRSGRHAMTRLLPEEKDQVEQAVIEHLQALKEIREQAGRPLRMLTITIQFHPNGIRVDSRSR